MTNTNRTAMEAFAAEYEIEMTWTPGPATRKDWPEGSRHYRVTLSTDLGSMTTDYSMGSGLRGDPAIGSVLECLASDAESALYQSFEEWCDALGYDTDSRSALATYTACVDAGADLENLLGPGGFDRLMEGLRDGSLQS